jgi:NodT family efflux transporter outer membrane factor (OMF) lipoprotein
MNSRRRLRAGAALMLAAALGACAVGPDFVAPLPPSQRGYTPQPVVPAGAGAADPRQTIAADDAAVGWWRGFDSPALDATVELALRASPGVAQATSALAQAEALARAAAGARAPQLDVVAQAERSGGGGASAADVYSAGPLVAFDADVFGRQRRLLEQQRALADVQRAQLDAVRQALAATIVARAIDVAAAREQLAAVARLLEVDRDALTQVEDAQRAGAASAADVAAARSQLAADTALRPPLLQQQALARDALAVLVGHAPVDWRAPDFELEQLRLPRELPLTVPSALVRRRPDLVAAQAQLHAASAAIGVATADLYPQLTLSASWSWQGSAVGALFDAPALWQLAAGATAPLWHGGALRARREAAEAAWRGQLAAYRATVLDAFGQVADVMQALDHDAQLIAAQRGALDAADASLRLQREAWAAGGASYAQVLLAQRARQQALLGYARARAQRYLDTAQWYAAIGAPAN